MSNDEVSEVYQIMNSDVLEVLVIGENVDQLSEKTSCLVSATKLAPNQQVPSRKIQSMSISDHSDAPEDQQMSLDERYLLITSIVDPEDRNIEEDEKELRNEELQNLLHRKSEPIAYDGFEPSGRMHIAQGVLKAINVNKLTDAGCKVKLLIADWFAMMNDKMGGDMQKIETVGRYFIEVWKSVGMKNLEKVEFVWSSKEISSRGHEYWPRVMDIARRNSLNRIIRCTQIMGREDRDNLSAAQIMYPCMQCADVFFLNADICQMGTDQLKVNMLAREYCDKIKEDKPVILSHRMLPGLKEGQDKMSKSDPTSAIYMEDDEAEVNLKIKKAHCAPKEVEGNPCLEYVQHLVFPWFHEFVVERSEKNGGDKTFANFQDLSKDYASGELHPGDLKPALAKALNKILEPVRSHFKNDPTAKQLLQSVKSFRVTR